MTQPAKYEWLRRAGGWPLYGALAGAVLVAPLEYWGRMGGSMVIFILLRGGWYAVWAAVFSTALPVVEVDE